MGRAPVLQITSVPTSFTNIIAEHPSRRGDVMKFTQRNLGLWAGCATLFAATLVSGQDWPQWRGPNRDNKIVGFSVPKEWPKDLTKKWKKSVGVGEASPILAGDKVFTF